MPPRRARGARTANTAASVSRTTPPPDSSLPSWLIPIIAQRQALQIPSSFPHPNPLLDEKQSSLSLILEKHASDWVQSLVEYTEALSDNVARMSVVRAVPVSTASVLPLMASSLGKENELQNENQIELDVDINNIHPMKEALESKQVQENDSVTLSTVSNTNTALIRPSSITANLMKPRVLHVPSLDALPSLKTTSSPFDISTLKTANRTSNSATTNELQILNLQENEISNNTTQHLPIVMRPSDRVSVIHSAMTLRQSGENNKNNTEDVAPTNIGSHAVNALSNPIIPSLNSVASTLDKQEARIKSFLASGSDRLQKAMENLKAVSSHVVIAPPKPVVMIENRIEPRVEIQVEKRSPLESTLMRAISPTSPHAIETILSSSSPLSVTYQNIELLAMSPPATLKSLALELDKDNAISSLNPSASLLSSPEMESNAKPDFKSPSIKAPSIPIETTVTLETTSKLLQRKSVIKPLEKAVPSMKPKMMKNDRVKPDLPLKQREIKPIESKQNEIKPEFKNENRLKEIKRNEKENKEEKMEEKDLNKKVDSISIIKQSDVELNHSEEPLVKKVKIDETLDNNDDDSISSASSLSYTDDDSQPPTPHSAVTPMLPKKGSKNLPTWVLTPELRVALRQQSRKSAEDVFGENVPPLDLEGNPYQNEPDSTTALLSSTISTMPNDAEVSDPPQPTLKRNLEEEMHPPIKRKKGYTEELKYVRKAAQLGNTNALYRLGNMYRDGKVFVRNYVQAVKYYRKASELGHPGAPLDLGVCYQYGHGVVKNVQEAIYWFWIASSRGNAMAQSHMAYCYYNGIGVTKNWEEAFKLYYAASQQGIPLAQFNLANCYQNGHGTLKNDTEAVKWFHKAAEKGISEAQINLSVCYKTGLGVEMNLEEAVRFCKMAADQKNPTALFHLGQFYYYGDGVKQCYNQALHWFLKAAKFGHAEAMYTIGKFYFHGLAKKQNNREAIKWFLKAADRGFVVAQFEMGKLYEEGTIVEQKFARAAKWFQKAAEQGDAKAQYYLAKYYYYGIGVPQCQEEAVKWYQQAADQGNAGAQENLGAFYLVGLGVPQNTEEAMKWMQKAAEQRQEEKDSETTSENRNNLMKWFRDAAQKGYAVAQNIMDSMLSFGVELDQSHLPSTKSSNEAEKQGHSDPLIHLDNAMNSFGQCESNDVHCHGAETLDQASILAQFKFNLGRLYALGLSVDQDRIEALKWLRQAVNQSTFDFHTALDSLNREMMARNMQPIDMQEVLQSNDSKLTDDQLVTLISEYLQNPEARN